MEKQQRLEASGRNLQMSADSAGLGLWMLGILLSEKAGRGEGLDETETRGVAALIGAVSDSLDVATDEYKEDEAYITKKKKLVMAA